jgi:hypothetical protein
MCTWIIEKTEMEGSAKGPDGWFKLAQANVYYDAPIDHALVIDRCRATIRRKGVSLWRSARSRQSG